MKKLCLLTAVLLWTSFSAAQFTNETMHVDATDAPRNILHSTLKIQVTPGPLTLVYPKWIPGNHRPTGPIHNMVGLHIMAGGKELEWQRDLVDMYAFQLTVPDGVKELEVSFDTVTWNGKSSASSSQVMDLNWNQVIMYPSTGSIGDVLITPSIRLPEGWKFGTSLEPAQQSGSSVTFRKVTMGELVDSPLIAGDHYRQVQLSRPGDQFPNVMDMVAETDAALQMSAKDLASYKQLVDEAIKLFGARHYEKYHFLVTLSDETAHHGLEHHQSSDNGTAEDTFSDPNWHNLEADLLPHEFVHSWNGKFKRPRDLITLDFQRPMKGDLLWVYEGLTDYLGDILAARTGLRSAEQWRDNAAYTAAMLDHRAGRTWRPLQDTATSVQISFSSSAQWSDWRRGADYYPEGFLIWLEIDTMIRQQTKGQKSLNDFCRKFFGGSDTPAMIFPYAFDDVVKALNEVAPYDWAKMLRERLDSKAPHAPLGGIENGGWKLVYTAQKNTTMEAREKTGDSLDLSFSLGLTVTKDGTIVDVIHGSPAYAAGLGPGMKLVAVNTRKYSKDVIRAALQAAVNGKQPIALLAENSGFFNTYPVDYHGGEQYPHLARTDGKPDLLGDIIKPLAPQ
ncbi:MAG: M61 family peptidase [Acidobacteriia bacterium]|nr:M61 family peptidase [Terriglobia bacterium]